MGTFRSLIGNRKPNKYRNHSVKIDGIRFASKGEGKRYLELKDMLAKKEIKQFELQPEFILLPRYWKCCKKVYTDQTDKKNRCPICGQQMATNRPIIYRADFRIIHNNDRVSIEDVKGTGGFTTPDFENKKKWFEFRYPELTLEIVKRSGKGMEMFCETQPEVKETETDITD
jgi:hypothetical protein